MAQRFADETSRALGLALRLAARTKMSQNLLNALASRGVIDQALGVIMVENRCTADEAFEMLRMKPALTMQELITCRSRARS